MSSSPACDGSRRVSSSSSDDAKEKEEEGKAICQKKTKTTESEKEDQDRVSPHPDPEEEALSGATGAEALLQSQLGAMALTPGPSQQHQVGDARPSPPSLPLLRVASLNVHGFVDAKGRDNFDRVAQLIRDHRPDVLCLQESGRGGKTPHLHSELSDLFCRTGICQRTGCSILSRYPLTKIHSHRGRKKSGCPRYVTCLVDVASDKSKDSNSGRSRTVSVTSIHLSHKFEGKRVRELESIRTDVEGSPEVPKDSTKIFAGDFNSLTLSDYSFSFESQISARSWTPSPTSLERVAEVRRLNRWEEPRGQVTEKMAKMGFKDAAFLCPYGYGGPHSTCRFDTRIDYVFVRDPRPPPPGGGDDVTTSEVRRLEHVASDASDHNMVWADLDLKTP